MSWGAEKQLELPKAQHDKERSSETGPRSSKAVAMLAE